MAKDRGGSSAPYGEALKALASRVLTIEAVLVLLGVVVWLAVLQNLSKLDTVVAIGLLIAVLIVTLYILFIMHKRTELLRTYSDDESTTKLEESVNRRVRPPPTKREYGEQLRSTTTGSRRNRVR